MVIKLAWRNIWRNRRRSVITLVSIIFAVVLCVLMDSLKKGLLDKMKDNIVGLYSGYAQVHAEGYWDERSLENSFSTADNLHPILQDEPRLKDAIPRLESFILAASGEFAKGSMIIGMDPAAESTYSGLAEKVIAGQYLEANDRAVMITQGLAEYLNLRVSDTLVLLGQGYHGASAVAKYPIKGLLKFGSPDLDRGMIYLPLSESQELFGAPQRMTAFVLQLKDPELASQIAGDLDLALGDQYEAMSWEEMSPDLDQFIRGEETENVVFQIILYLLIGFGIFGTILMMTMEREREFGIMVAIGMKKWRLLLMVVLECLMLAILGALGGMLLSFPITYYFFQYPINISGQLAEAYENFGIEPVFYFSIEPEIFYTQAIVVLFLASLLSLFPLIKIFLLKPVAAMRK